MTVSYNQALEIAKDKYPHQINHFEEYRGYFVFSHEDGNEYVGGTKSPIVIRKADGAALNYAPIFFNLDVDAEDVGEVISQGAV